MRGFYPKTDQEIEMALKQISSYDSLTCSVKSSENFFGNSNIDNISFAVKEEDGVSFSCTTNTSKKILRDFFESYEGTVMYYDMSKALRVLVYNLYMTDLYDYNGMTNGIEELTSNFEDVKLITYLATNSCSGNYLELRQQSDGRDSSNNLEEAINIWYIYNKHYNTMIKDDQGELYNGLFKESSIQILQMELVGMPVDMEAINKANKRLTRLNKVYTNFLNAKLDDIKIDRLNINSGKQLQELLYADFRLPVIDRTKSRQPSTSVKTLEKLVHHCKKHNHRMIIRCIINLSKVNSILTTIIPKLLESNKMIDGNYRIYGNFNLGGAVSGRLSSSDPNLHGIPSGSTYAKLVKSCFRSPNGKVFSGADFSALEDVVNSLLTKDPNKLKVYIAGYDSHMLRSVTYWPQEFKYLERGIESNDYYKANGNFFKSNESIRTENGVSLTIEECYQYDLGNFYNIHKANHIEYDVNIINSLTKTKYKIREVSKAVTFPLQYFGTPETLKNNCGLTIEESIIIYNNYHEMYSVSDEWVKKEINEITKVGYATTAFGLRIRTPKLANAVLSSNIHESVMAEIRTVGNAISGQSYGLITNKAANDFRRRVLNSKYKYDINIVSLIHDAIYIESSDDIEVIEWINLNLIECMTIDNIKELYHDTVKLSANLEIFYPSWSNPIEIKNNSNSFKIKETIKLGVPHL